MIDFLKLETNIISQIEYFKNHILLDWVSDTARINKFDNEVITTKKIKQYIWRNRDILKNKQS